MRRMIGLCATLYAEVNYICVAIIHLLLRLSSLSLSCFPALQLMGNACTTTYFFHLPNQILWFSLIIYFLFWRNIGQELHLCSHVCCICLNLSKASDLIMVNFCISHEFLKNYFFLGRGTRNMHCCIGHTLLEVLLFRIIWECQVYLCVSFS